MNIALGSCFCGRPADRLLASNAYCQGCLDAVLGPIRKAVARRTGIGYGEQHGPLRPDWGPRYAELQCCFCEAGWVGPVGEQCSWCDEALENMRRWQAEILMRPELPDHDDARYPDAVIAWMERLARGVVAELITEQQALAAVKRQART
jgi:hypothetical protein